MNVELLNINTSQSRKDWGIFITINLSFLRALEMLDEFGRCEHTLKIKKHKTYINGAVYIFSLVVVAVIGTLKPAIKRVVWVV
jgi:quinol-cytochrome oxidoreductase complex cytochrome b subunit